MTDNTATEQATTRRTKRRLAHELYPSAEEFETRPLAVEVPYLYARAIGMDLYGTGWSDTQSEDLKLAGQRTIILGAARSQAFLADALLQGMTGDEAWAWADQRSWNYEGESLYERATHYGVPVDQIKPYPCGPELAYHYHDSEPDKRGNRWSKRVDVKESECPECTEDAPTAVTA
jgi:hypothetical protein